METLLFNNVWAFVSPLLVKFLLALLALFVGYFLAKWIGWAVTAALKLLRLDVLAKKIGLASFLEKGEIKRTIAELCGDLIYWLILFLTIALVAKVLAISIKAIVLTTFAFAGTVFLVAVTLGIGLFLATLMSNFVKVIALNFGLEGGKAFARTIYYIIIIFALLAALAELGIKVELIGGKLDVIIGAFGLAAAIAFGLGCKDMAADFLYNLFRGK